jgi:hypothetical protein
LELTALLGVGWHADQNKLEGVYEMKKITLALTALALLNAGSAYAAGISANVGPVGASVGAGPVGLGAGLNVGPIGTGAGFYDSNVLSYPAVVGGSTVLGAPTVLSYPAVYEGTNGACATPCATTRRGFFGNIFRRDRALLDVSALGTGVQIGGNGPLLYGRGLLGNRTSGCLNTMSYSAVIPSGACGGARGLNGERIGNPLFDLSLFNFGLRAGTVDPRWDMRPVGL